MSKQIDDLYAKARKALATGEASQWEAAEAMTELSRLGQSQREIAEKLGCGHATVGRYLAVIRGSGRAKNRGSFQEAYALANPSNAPGHHPAVPKAPEARAELVAELLKDKAIADAPEVRKVQERHTDRRMRQEMADWNRERGVATRTDTDRERRLQSVSTKSLFWSDILSNVNLATRKLAEATSEVERTGLADRRSGEIIRQVRALSRAADKFVEAATSAGIGQAM
jgi:transposase